MSTHTASYDPNFRYPIVDFSAILIHVHQIDFKQKAKIVSVKPGIHFAVTLCEREDLLRRDIASTLHQSVNGEHAPPSGPRRGILENSMFVRTDFCEGEMDLLYDLGINVIRRRQGMLVMWGQRFVTRSGQIERMVDIPKRAEPYRRGTVHPGLYDLVQTTD